ncbi:alpha-D-ribose 1-methylphosphonate 5-triphosphate diphosphatase [Puniceibacterium sediminis]|uniref:Alpha-D-ribose 1-methylphosphonate 5-triphosphate diphosphatase n=1 Tax=Puniceibacterium sediminis TaxID=1608407 RepID=A0A238V323_9RHOB|nr:alpha-D-ribose 1-methylphosphonate 5-triphosphate diphosphatase [Puniceibacterium sediminis]SNR28417.1 alpha-D-ribose 1-methylphosphonate 5-triphosphate diphosphatase [Puniceibacterium sediminis]
MTDQMILSNARIVLDDEIVTGSLLLRDGLIAAIDTGAQVSAGAVDCGGDLVTPGLIELHTDNLERHLSPRPGVDWPHEAAILAHDGELAACGITTVFDALRVGSIASPTGMGYKPYARALASEIHALREAGHLRISHHLHLRAEMCSQTLTDELDAFGPEDRVGLLSLMDHTPGQRQFVDVDKFRQYIQGKYGLPDETFAAYVAELKDLQATLGPRHEAAAVAAAARFGAALASHDDTSAAQVAQSAAHGVAIAEFPTTAEAARACRAAGIAVMMGAPNIIRGGSHSGNVAAASLAQDGLLDVLSSDYVPAALLTAALQLARLTGDLPRALATVTSAPARAVGLTDRGRIATGLRADLVRLRRVGETARPVSVWSAGQRVA